MFKKKIKKISVYRYIYLWLSKHLDEATQIFIEFTILKNFFLINKNYMSGSHKPLLYLYINYFSYIYKNFTSNFKKKFNFKEKNIFILTHPKKQLFITFVKTTPIFIFSNGMMRVVMGVEEKHKKKSKIILKNTMKYICVFANKLFINDELIIKIKKNYSLLNIFFSQYKKFCKNVNINYILYEPNVKFSFLNNKKRSSIKKNLRKNKKL